MAKLIYFGKVENGILKLTNKSGFSNDLKDYEGKEVRLTVERKSKRSNPQNDYFHGCVIPIVRAHLLDLGWKEAKSTEWVKDYIKFHCLIKEFTNEDTGEVMKSLGKTSDLTTSEFKEFIEDVQQWAATELDLVIPDPGEILSLDI
jgi:hypothetical protein